jgi:hypothetical protein
MERTASFLAGFVAILIATSSANAGLVYLDDTNGDLFAGNPVTGVYTYIGTSTRAAIFDGFTDIAFTTNGNLYGLDPSGLLYEINPANGHIINEGGTNNSIGTTGISNGSLVGLAADGNTLWAGGTNAVYTLNTSTGAATAVGSNTGTAYATEGDLEFVNGVLYLTSTGDSGGDFFTVNTTTGVGTFIGNLGESQVFGLAYDTGDSTLYGYTATGLQFTINPMTGAVSNVMTITVDGGEDPISMTNEILGASFGSTVPEPGSFGLLLTGMGALATGGAFARRRKA